MDTYTSEELLDLLPSMIEDIVEKKQQCKVTSEKGNLVILSEETYMNILITLELLSTPGLINNIDFETIQEQYPETQIAIL